ncbi:hypothetical protein pb186bvf_018754 [Paramecium bursaria]
MGCISNREQPGSQCQVQLNVEKTGSVFNSTCQSLTSNAPQEPETSNIQLGQVKKCVERKTHKKKSILKTSSRNLDSQQSLNSLKRVQFKIYVFFHFINFY